MAGGSGPGRGSDGPKGLGGSRGRFGSGACESAGRRCKDHGRARRGVSKRHAEACEACQRARLLHSPVPGEASAAAPCSAGPVRLRGGGRAQRHTRGCGTPLHRTVATTTPRGAPVAQQRHCTHPRQRSGRAGGAPPLPRALPCPLGPSCPSGPSGSSASSSACARSCPPPQFPPADQRERRRGSTCAGGIANGQPRLGKSHLLRQLLRLALPLLAARRGQTVVEDARRAGRRDGGVVPRVRRHLPPACTHGASKTRVRPARAAAETSRNVPQPRAPRTALGRGGEGRVEGQLQLFQMVGRRDLVDDVHAPRLPSRGHLALG